MEETTASYSIKLVLMILLVILFSTSTVTAQLTLESTYPTLGLFGQDIEIFVAGTGFDENTRIAMYPDARNKRAIIGSVDTPDNARSIAVVGDLAYIADDDNGLQIIDVSNSSNPKIIGSVDTPGTAQVVTVAGDLAFVADYWEGLQIIDVSNPLNPQIIGTLEYTMFIQDVVVIDNNAYVADENGFYVVDISSPTSPVIIGSVGTSGIECELFIVGNTAFVADYWEGLVVIDISSPTEPEIIGSNVTPDWATDVTVHNSIAYVTCRDGSIQLIDVSNTTNPEIIGSISAPGGSAKITIVDDRAYVASGIYGLNVIDINNLEIAPIIGGVDTPGRALDLVVVGGTAYVADGESGLQVIDIVNPVNPVVIGSVETPGRTRSVSVRGNMAYVADGESGLQVIDISNQKNPHIVGSADTPDSASDVVVVDNIAYVTDAFGGLQLIEISNPNAPFTIGSVETLDYASGITVVGDKAYVADRIGLKIINIGNPINPQIIGSVDMSGDTRCVAVAGNVAYMASNIMGNYLHVIDINDPTNPQIITSVNQSGGNSIKIVGNIAYVINSNYGLNVIDVSNPSNPQTITSVDIPGYAYGLMIVDDLAFVANGDSGFKVIDISNPSNPLIIGAVDTPGSAYEILAVGEKAYVLNGDELVILPLLTEITDFEVTSPTTISVSLPSPIMEAHYTLRTFNNTENDELIGAVSFTTDVTMLNTKAIIVAGGGPDAAGEIWEETKQSANKAYDVLVHEGFDHENIWYLTDEYDNPFRNGSSRRSELDWAINQWASEASQLLLFFVDHGIRNHFIIHDSQASSELLSVDELDDWLDNLQQSVIGPVTFIYDACHSGTFASKLIPPIGKDRIVITGASDEAAYFRGEDSFSFQLWEQILLNEGNLGYAFSDAAEIMRGYQTPLINSNGNSNTNETEDYTLANQVVVRRAKQIYLKPAPTITNVSDPMILNGQSLAEFWVNGVREADNVWAKIIPPNIDPEQDGVPVTDLDTIELLDSDHDGTYEGTYNGFTLEGTYLIVINAYSSQELYSYVHGSEIIQTITSTPVYTSASQMIGTHDISTDTFEEDDTYHLANIITLNDLDVQSHNFHDLGDVDWIKFYGLSGQKYTINASNLSLLCDVIIELFSSDGTTRLVGPINDTGIGQEESLEWTCLHDGVYYIKITNANMNFGELVNYELKVYRPVGVLQTLLRGTVTDDNTGNPIGNALIATTANASALSFANESVGRYLMSHIPGSFSFTVSAEDAGYPQKVYSDIEIAEALSMTLDFTLEPDSDGDGVIDDNDGCPDDPNKFEPGDCGCNVIDIDTDSDGTADCMDAFPSDPTESLDTDEDGIGDNADPDDDNDGISDVTEAAGPNSGDANNDGITDSLQNNVASIQSYTYQGYVVIESSPGTTLSDCQTTGNPSPEDAPVGIDFTYDFFNFTITGLTPGGSTSVTITLPDGASPVTYYKYGMTPDNQTDHWYEFLYNGITGAEIDGNVITLQFTDALTGDDVLVQDSMIIDLGAPGFNILQGRTALYFPHVDTNAPWGTEIAIFNTSADQTLTGTLNAYDNDGAIIDNMAISLDSRARRQLDVGAEFNNATAIGYLILDTEAIDVQGYTKFYQEGVYRVAVPAVKEINTGVIYVSHIASVTNEWWTGLSLVNTTGTSVTPTITFDTGDTREIILNAGEHQAFTVAGLFDGTPQPNINSAVITNAAGIVGLELFGSAGGGRQLSGILLKDTTTRTLFYPHVASDEMWWTGIVAYNPSSTANSITITPYTNEGTPLTPQAFGIDPNGKYIGTAAQLAFPAGTAWFKVEAGSPITGFELFGTNDLYQMAGYTGVGISTRAGVFAKIEKVGWTGIAFVNTEGIDATVTLVAYDDAGTVVATEVLSLNGFAKVVDLAENLFAQDISTATCIAYASDNEIVGFQLNGSTDGMLLDGLPGLSTSVELP